MNSNQNDIDELIARSLAGESTAEEEERLSTWIAQSDDNRQRFQKIKRVLTLSDAYYKTKQQEPNLDINQEWNHFLTLIDSGKERKLRPAAKSYSLWMRVAAAVLLVVAVGSIFNLFVSDKTTVIETADATQLITLPDGSQVTINENSQLTYSTDFGKSTRTLTLKGEAFFDVARDPQKPFIISANEATIEVLGTSFNVQAYDTGKKIEVVVATGTVKLSVPTMKQAVMLQAGDRGVYSRTDKELTNATNADINFLAWKTRKIIFIETELHTVVETLNHAYGANIILEAKVPDTCLVTVTFDQQSLDAVLNVLKTTLNLTYRIENGKIVITHAGC
ncbi:MAG: FecR domain-containing protein [Cyclobacteriaceae bacterium]|nr:FecR domain-containing protein [Cyclobacteriaceae bacterium]